MPGDFVEFIASKEWSQGTDTQIANLTYNQSYISAVALDENRVFIAYTYDYNGRYLYGVVCTISDNTITIGTTTQLSTNKYSGNNISVVKLSNNKIIIVYHKADDATDTGYIGGIMCNINETEIIVKIDKYITPEANNYFPSIVALSDTKIFVTYVSSRNNNLYGMLCEGTDTDIIVKANIALGVQSHYLNASIAKLSENKVCIIYSSYSTSNYTLTGLICNINENTISPETATALGITNVQTQKISAIALSNSTIFITYCNQTGLSLQGLVCEIQGSNIIAGTSVQLSSVNRSGYMSSLIAISSDTVFIAHDYENKLAETICTIKEKNITINQTVLLSDKSGYGESISATKISDNKIFIAHCPSYQGDSKVMGMVCVSEEAGVKTLEGTNNIFGVAQQKGTEGQLIKVVVPNRNKEEN